MPVYTSCAFECTHKELGRKLVKDLNHDGVLCFFVGDIPMDQRYEMLEETTAALDRSQIFMPFVCQHFEGNRLGSKELAYANNKEKLIMPVLLDPDFGSVKPGGLLTGLNITDLSTSSKYKEQFPKFLETVNALLAAAKAAKVRSGSDAASSSASSAGNGDDRSTASATGDQDDASEMAADEDTDAESEAGDNDSRVTKMEDDDDEDEDED